jgi:mRNA interferase RelE/StbE
LLSLPAQMRVRVSNAIDALRAEPRPPGARKLEGEFHDGWRIRVGRFRVLYEVDDSRREVRVFRVGPRDTVYRR